MTKVADDETLGRIARQQHDLFRRVREGLDADLVSVGIQELSEGHFNGRSMKRLLVVDYSARHPEFGGFRLVSHPLRGDKAVIDLRTVSRASAHCSAEPRKCGEDVLGMFVRAFNPRQLLDAMVLMELLKHTEKIPEDWKDNPTYFLGTILLDSNGLRTVPFLRFSHEEWDWQCRSLRSTWEPSWTVAVIDSKAA